MQNGPAAFFFLVVPVHDGGLVRGVHAVVVEVAAGREAAAPELALQLGPALDQGLVVGQLHMEEVPAALEIGDPRLPEEVQGVHPGHGHVPQTVQLLPVPEDPVEGHAGLELLPPVVGPDPGEVVLGQDHGDDLGQQGGLLRVVRRPGQAGGLGIGVHGVGVLGEQDVHQPGGLGLEPRGALLGDVLPVAELPELLVFDDPALQVGLSGPVAPEGLQSGPDLLPTDGRFICLLHASSFVRWSARRGDTVFRKSGFAGFLRRAG